MTDPSTVHIALDIETLSDRPVHALITHIAAVRWTVAHGVFDVLDLRLVWASDDRPGCVTMGTIAWWLRQSDEARAELVAEPRLEVDHALDRFEKFVGPDQPDREWWAYGSGFDFPALESLFSVSGRTVPWSFRQIRDARTARALLPTELRPTSLRKHIALDDAMWAAEIARAAHLASRERAA